jgi:hypothetical protein
LERDLHDRRRRAVHEGWTGEIERIDLTLRLLAGTKAAERAARTRPVAAPLGMPATRGAASRRRQPPPGTASDSILASESIAPEDQPAVGPRAAPLTDQQPGVDQHLRVVRDRRLRQGDRLG